MVKLSNIRPLIPFFDELKNYNKSEIDKPRRVFFSKVIKEGIGYRLHFSFIHHNTAFIHSVVVNNELESRQNEYNKFKQNLDDFMEEEGIYNICGFSNVRGDDSFWAYLTPDYNEKHLGDYLLRFQYNLNAWLDLLYEIQNNKVTVYSNFEVFEKEPVSLDGLLIGASFEDQNFVLKFPKKMPRLSDENFQMLLDFYKTSLGISEEVRVGNKAWEKKAGIYLKT